MLSRARKPQHFQRPNPFNFSSSHFSSSLLSPGPPAQWPQIDGKQIISPIPGLMFATSISESSGLWLSVEYGNSGTLGNSREIQICFAGYDECLGLYGLHCSVEIAIVGLLLRAITSLPGIKHHKQILGICMILSIRHLILWMPSWMGARSDSVDEPGGSHVITYPLMWTKPPRNSS